MFIGSSRYKIDSRPLGGELMVRGLGVDIIEIKRIELAYQRHGKAFIARLLAPEEETHWQENGSRVESLSGAWAAKEAVAKALGTGFRDFNLRDIIVQHDPLGKPIVLLLGGALGQAKTLMIERVLVTISHSETYTIAFAVAE